MSLILVGHFPSTVCFFRLPCCKTYSLLSLQTLLGSLQWLIEGCFSSPPTFVCSKECLCSDLTSEHVHWVVKHRYSVNADGIPGNDDYGALSGWLVWAYLVLFLFLSLSFVFNPLFLARASILSTAAKASSLFQCPSSRTCGWCATTVMAFTLCATDLARASPKCLLTG